MRIVVSFLCLIISLYSCNQRPKAQDESWSSQDQVIEIIDTQGNNVRLDSAAQRVVCLFDPAIDIIYMLWAQDKLVGINMETYYDKELYDYYKHIDSRIANKELATPGSNDMLNIESAMALKPDLIIAQNLSPNVIKTLNSMGTAVYLSTSESYDHLMKEMEDIAVLLGKNDRGQQLINYAMDKTEQLQARSNNHKAKAPTKNAYFSWANGRIFSTAGRNSMMNDCLVLAGVDNVCPTDIDKPNINPETLIDWNPDMIVMWNDSPDLFYNKKELASVKAIQSKQIFNLIPMFYYNPHTFKALCVAAAINGWAYPDITVNVDDEINEIITTLYGDKVGNELLKYKNL
ncbi:ABC transporter substrate-binding protein [Sphingobacterium rhinopitheci]|uniref:ABC transporter substrate-binding protein n=1 Tax=Sphingobacterium rhinopitheci TaxID=2781960 RepID=UPI001F5168A2|nr:ABC transporter substrate-binding protein [Sphingobacterium rhinopitheci]MCI0922649.1 ABC transporter substrate-binding protein [Sphingobacterium rhinopitheci]